MCSGPGPQERLKKMLADRELMTSSRPSTASCTTASASRGKFSDSSSLAESLRRHGTIQANQVVMTVVEPRPMFIRATAAEESTAPICGRG